jgi:hypothetical protein
MRFCLKTKVPMKDSAPGLTTQLASPFTRDDDRRAAQT